MHEGLRKIFDAKDKEHTHAHREDFVESIREDLPDLVAFIDEEIEDCFAVFGRRNISTGGFARPTVLSAFMRRSNGALDGSHFPQRPGVAPTGGRTCNRIFRGMAAR